MRYQKKSLECSSQGDTRFSAFFARVTLPFNDADVTKTIEEWYQLAKRFGKIKPRKVKDAKGKAPTHLVVLGKRYAAHFLGQWYKILWLKYLDENPDLVKFASMFDEFTDVKRGRRTVNCQADVVKQYVKQGRQSLINDCEYLLNLMDGWDIFMAKKPTNDLPVVNAWTDGSCKNNGKPDAIGGWAYIVEHEGVERERAASQEYNGVTNNQMELRAFIELFKRLKQPCLVILNTDSEYVERAFSEGRLKRWLANGWKVGRKPVANKEMWMELCDAIRSGKHKVQVLHADEETDPNIKRCHVMATQATKNHAKRRAA